MNKDEIIKELLIVISDIGILGVDENNFDALINNDIRDFIVDSLQFVGFILNVENKFKINLPESFLFADFSISFEVLVQYIDDKINT